MGDRYTLEEALVRDIKGLIGGVTDDEAALVRTLTPPDMTRPAMVEHLLDLVDVLTTIRSDEAMAEYVYAIAPHWDGGTEMLLLGARVTTAFHRCTLEQVAPERVG